MTYPRQAVLLLAEALRPGAGGPEAAARREGADWMAVLALANEHYLAPALHASLSEAGALSELPEEVRDYLALLHDGNARRNRRLREQAEGLVRGFIEAGIVPLLLKGGLALFLGHHRDPAARMIRDLDVMVPQNRLQDALRVLDGLGYRAVARYPAGHHACGDFAKAGEPGAVDLHIEPIDCDYLLPASSVWRRACPVRLADSEFLAPAPADCLLHNLLHAQIHHVGNYYRGVIELRQLHDFVALARHHAEAVDWNRLGRRLSEQALEGPLHAYLLAAERLFGLPWPLDERPSPVARLQYRRCLLQLQMPRLGRAGLPLANLYGAFARHRMEGLYGGQGSLLQRRLRHGWRFLSKSSLRGSLDRLFKEH